MGFGIGKVAVIGVGLGIGAENTTPQTQTAARDVTDTHNKTL